MKGNKRRNIDFNQHFKQCKKKPIEKHFNKASFFSYWRKV
jgi:hypothetical protein